MVRSRVAASRDLGTGSAGGRNVSQFLRARARETVQYAAALSAGAFARLNHAPQLPRETRFTRPGDRRAPKHRTLRAKVARDLALVGGRSSACNSASWEKRCDGPPTLAHRSFSPSALRSGTESPNYCALTLIKVFASSVSFLSVAPSSSSVCCKSLAPLVSPSTSA